MRVPWFHTTTYWLYSNDEVIASIRARPGLSDGAARRIAIEDHCQDLFCGQSSEEKKQALLYSKVVLSSRSSPEENNPPPAGVSDGMVYPEVFAYKRVEAPQVSPTRIIIALLAFGSAYAFYIWILVAYVFD